MKSVIFLKFLIGISVGILAYYGVTTILFKKEFNFWIALIVVCLGLFIGFLYNRRKIKNKK